MIVVELKYGVGSKDGMTPVTLRAALDRTAEAVSKPMRYIGPELSGALEKSLRARFAHEGAGGPVSGAWAALSADYAAWKKIHYPGRKKLVLRGKLRPALTSSSSPNALRETTDNALVFGTRGIEYASFHQTGTPRMPARPLFDFGGPEFDRSVRTAIQKGFVAALRAARAEALAR